MNSELYNKKERVKIARMVFNAGEGHIPSSYSIIDILSVLYDKILRYDPKNPNWKERDYFILSKGHGAAALFITLEKHGFITQKDLERKSKEDGILGGHPDCTRVPGVEASTGSLGHGLVTAMGLALGLKIRRKKNKVICIIGDGECNEGSVWETALVASNLSLGNLCFIVDNNKSAEQILPVSNLDEKWRSFGWEIFQMNGHDITQIFSVLSSIEFRLDAKPKIIISDTIKGKGVSFIEGHGKWHHHVPSKEEMDMIEKELRG